MERGGEGADGLLPRVAQTPQPGKVDVGVADGGDMRFELAAGAPHFNLGGERAVGRGDRLVEAVVAREVEVDAEVDLVERLEHDAAAQVVLP